MLRKIVLTEDCLTHRMPSTQATDKKLETITGLIVPDWSTELTAKGAHGDLPGENQGGAIGAFFVWWQWMPFHNLPLCDSCAGGAVSRVDSIL
jgi:hypothetical protein